MRLAAHVRQRIAIEELAKSRHVKNRMRGEARFLGVDLDTQVGRKWLEERCLEYAKIILRE